MPNIELTTASSQQKKDILDVLGAPQWAVDENGNAVGLTGLTGEIEFDRFLSASGDFGAALQAAHDALPAGGGAVRLKSQIYTATTKATLTKPIAIYSSGPAGAARVFTNNPALTIIETSASITLDNIGFRYNGPGGAQNGCRAVLITGGFAPTLNRCQFDLFDIGVELTGAWGLRALFCRFWDCKTYGMKIANVASPDTGDHELYGLQFANSQFPTAPAALYWASSGGLKIHGGKWLDHAYSILMEVVDGANTKIFSITGASLEGMRTGAIRITRALGGSTGTFNSVIINGNQFGARGEWGATPKIISLGSGVSDAVITGNVIEGGSAAGNYGVFIEDAFLGGGLIGNNEFFDVNTAVRDPGQGSAIRIAPNRYKGTCRVRHEGGGTQGAARGGIDPIVTDIAEWNANQVGTTYYAYKIHIPSNACAEIRLSWAGIQNGGGGAARYRHFVAFNNGGSISLTDIVASTTYGTATTWNEYTGVVGTNIGEDGVAIGFKPTANQPMQGELRIDVTGQTNKIRKLQLFPVRTAAYSWTLSGSGTNEYYLRTSTNANPNIPFPAVVLTNLGTEVSPNYAPTTRGNPGSLAADRWGFGDNDGLGYSTLYVRLAAGNDPDTGINNLLQAWA